MLLTAWTHKQLDTVIYSTKVLARRKSGEKKKKPVKCNILNQPRFRCCFYVHGSVCSRITLYRQSCGGSNYSSGFCTSASDCVISLGQYVWEVGRWKKNLIWLEFDSILVKLWNETFKYKDTLQSLVFVLYTRSFITEKSELWPV